MTIIASNGNEWWWAVEAMIASYTHAYQVIYKTTYEIVGPIGVTIYGNSPIVPYQYEFLAMNQNPRVVTDAVEKYPLHENDTFILSIFHDTPSVPDVKAKYQSLGYDFVRTGPILGRSIPGKRRRNEVDHIQKAATIHQAEFANENLTNEGERIPLDSLRDENIHNFYAEISGHAVGWVQLVTVYPNVGYIHHVFTLSMYRGLKIGSSLIERAQLEAVSLGCKNIMIVPSDMAMGMAVRLGYRPLAYFTAFRPSREEVQYQERTTQPK